MSEVVAGTVDDLQWVEYPADASDDEPMEGWLLRVIGKGFTDEDYGIGLKQGDNRLDQVRSALKEYISSGAWKKSLDANIAPSGYAIPAPPTVK